MDWVATVKAASAAKVVVKGTSANAQPAFVVGFGCVLGDGNICRSRSLFCEGRWIVCDSAVAGCGRSNEITSLAVILDRSAKRFWFGFIGQNKKHFYEAGRFSAPFLSDEEEVLAFTAGDGSRYYVLPKPNLAAPQIHGKWQTPESRTKAANLRINCTQAPTVFEYLQIKNGRLQER